MHYLLILEVSKIYIKICIKITPTCFGPRPSSASLHLSLTKVSLMLKQSVKLRRYILCGGVVACYVQLWRVCSRTIPGYNMLLHRHIIHKDVILPIVLT
jgi:hypothetical protein